MQYATIWDCTDSEFIGVTVGQYSSASICPELAVAAVVTANEACLPFPTIGPIFNVLYFSPETLNFIRLVIHAQSIGNAVWLVKWGLGPGRTETG